MSSSSSDSDSDEFEPIRKLKINIRPKGEIVNKRAADVSEIRASVEAWRPLGPPTHHTLSRRQSSLSSVSSISLNPMCPNQPIGQFSSHYAHNTHLVQSTGQAATIQSSPSCSSLVNEFNNKSSFSNFVSTISRTSSPLTFVNQGDLIPIAIAIQESIDVLVKGHYDPNATQLKYHSRSLGNIKIAFSNAFVKGNYGKPSAVLKLRLHSTENIIRYFASRLIRDLDTSSQNLIESTQTNNTNNININNHHHNLLSQTSNELFNDNNNKNSTSDKHTGHTGGACITTSQTNNTLMEFFDSGTSSPGTPTNSKLIEFDMDLLDNHLKSLYDQSPNARYYNVDVLRYQIAPPTSIDTCPLQVCAYWKIEPDLIKLRLDFKHSSLSGFKLERLRDVTFTVDFGTILLFDVNIESIYPNPKTKATSESLLIQDDNNITNLSYITHEPKAQWNNSIKQLVWKFDNLLQFYKNDGSGSLFAKIDFRNYNMPTKLSSQPSPVDIKFVVSDSSLSRMNPSLDSIGYKVSMMKKEIRSGVYKSEPFIL